MYTSVQVWCSCHNSDREESKATSNWRKCWKILLMTADQFIDFFSGSAVEAATTTTSVAPDESLSLNLKNNSGMQNVDNSVPFDISQFDLTAHRDNDQLAAAATEEEEEEEYTTTTAERTAGSASLSPSAEFIDPNLLDSYQSDKQGQEPQSQELRQSQHRQPVTQLDSILDDYELLLNSSNAHGSKPFNDRRHSEVIFNPLDEQMMMTTSRNSISNSIDFWNLKSPPRTGPRSKRISFDNDLNQLLEDYSLKFRNKAPSNEKENADEHNTLSSPKQQHQRRSSHSAGLVKKHTRKNSLSPPSVDPTVAHDNITKIIVPPQTNAILSDEDEEFISSFEFSAKKSKKSSSSASSSSTSIPKSTPESSTSTSNFIMNASPSAVPKFIKPSMILSENASKAAKVATSGVEEPSFLLNFSGNNSSNIAINRSEYNIADMTSSLGDRNTNIGSIKVPPAFPSSPTSAISPASSTFYNIPNNKILPILNSKTVSRRRRSSASVTPSKTSSVSIATSINPNTDDDPKPFKCSDCEKAFRRSEHLKRHIRSVHSSERPFECTFCDKKFSRSDNLSQHLKTHRKHGDF